MFNKCKPLLMVTIMVTIMISWTGTVWLQKRVRVRVSEGRRMGPQFPLH